MGKFIHGQVLANGHVLAHGSGAGPGPWGPAGGDTPAPDAFT